MTTKMKTIRLIPNLMISAGILAATYIAKADPLGSHKTLLSALTMASAILGADAVDSMLRYGVAALSWGSVLLSSGFLLAIWICRESGSSLLLIPSTGAIACVVLLGKSKSNSRLC